MASKSLGTLTLDLVARTGGFVQGMTKAERESKKWRRQVEKDMRKVGKAAKVSLVAVSGAALASGAALTKMAADGLKSVDSQNKVARSLDGTYNSLSALNIAFDEAGVDGYERSLSRMNRRLGAAETGTGAAAKTVEALNLNLADLSDMDVDERIATISDAIIDSGASAQQAARYAQDLGFEQKEAAQFFMQGGEAIRQYREEVEAYGLALSDIDAEQVEAANDEFAKIGRLTEGFSVQLASQLAPVVRDVSEFITDSFKASSGTMKEDIGSAVETAVSGMADILDASSTAIEFIDDNPISSSFGLMGWLLLGPKGALIGSVIGATFDLVKEGAASFGLFISDEEESARRLAGVQDQLERQRETLAKGRKRGFDENHEAIVDLKEDIAGLESVEANLKDQVSQSTEAQDKYNELMNSGTSEADGFAGGMRRLAETLRDIDYSTGAPGSDGPDLPDLPDLPGVGGDDDDDIQDKLDSRLEALRSHFETEKQTILRLYGERDEEITELEEARTATKMEADNLRYQNEKEKQEAITALYADEAKQREKIESDAQRAISSLQNSTIQNAIGLLNVLSGEHKAFALASIAITKGLAIAEATQNTAVAVMKAMTIDPSGIMAAKVKAMGAVNIGIIAATGLAQAHQATSGGSGGVGTGGYSSSGTHPPAPSTTDPAFSDDLEDDRRGVQINFHGDVNGLDADQISRSIKDHLDSTDFVLVEPASRNGRALAGR